MSPKNQLDQIQVPAVCSADWDTMVGNNQVRFCEHCNLSVHNLSAMTRQRALRLVANSRGRLCVRFVHGIDGRPITNLPVKLHNIGRRVSRFAAGAFTAALSLSSAAAQSPSGTIGTAPSSEQSVPTPAQKLITAEALSSSIRGTITASREKPVVGALVRLTNKDTGIELITSAREDGKYSFPAVYPGTYTLSTRAEGYTDIDVEGVTLFSNSKQRRDVTLYPDKPEELENTEKRTFTVSMGVVSVRTPQHPLVEAVYRDDLEAVKEMLFFGANANVYDEATQTSALDQAVENGNREMVRLLLSSRANANGSGIRRSPLMWLRDSATPELVVDLISAGAVVNQTDENGGTPLMNAASISNLAVVKTLIRMGARVNLSNNDGETPLMRAAANEDPNVIKVLVELGADVNAHDKDGKTALLLAASSDKPETIKLLLDAGAKANVTDNEGKTPLLIAASESSEAVLKLLIDAGADINAHDNEGQTALMVAASEAPVELVKLLIEAGAKIDVRDKDGQTALMRAAAVGDDDSAQLLLNAGADFRLRNNDGKSALALAREFKRPETITLLLAHGVPE